MNAILILKCYPAGIGNHIVCIDVGTAAVLQTRLQNCLTCRANPEPHIFFRKEKVRQKKQN